MSHRSRAKLATIGIVPSELKLPCPPSPHPAQSRCRRPFHLHLVRSILPPVKQRAVSFAGVGFDHFLAVAQEWSLRLRVRRVEPRRGERLDIDRVICIVASAVLIWLMICSLHVRVNKVSSNPQNVCS